MPPVSETVIRTLKAKYRIARNVFACCRLDVLEATDQEMKILVGVVKKGDRQLSIGTQLILQNPGEAMEFIATNVKAVEDSRIHICAPVKIQPLEERRLQPRRALNFTMKLDDHILKAINGNHLGITFECAGSHGTLTNLVVDRVYAFKATYKDVDYVFDGILRHLHYDWKTYHHSLGVHFPGVTQEQETVLHLLVDPTYTIPIASSSTIDTATGKISL